MVQITSYQWSCDRATAFADSQSATLLLIKGCGVVVSSSCILKTITCYLYFSSSFTYRSYIALHMCSSEL